MERIVQPRRASMAAALCTKQGAGPERCGFVYARLACQMQILYTLCSQTSSTSTLRLHTLTLHHAAPMSYVNLSMCGKL